MTFAHYLNHMALLSNQWTSSNYKDPQRQRIYMKDIDCPQLWHNKLQTVLPPFLYYLNDSTGDVGGLGAIDEPDPSGSGYRRGKGIAKAGDLMSCLPPEKRAENMMCYIGHEGTYTPAHREMCASLGQNIMVEASTGLVEDGKPTKPGSSLWFMTENKEREVVAEYWLSRLGHDIEVENHFAQINAWKTAPFKTYVVEQRPGDLILIPPLAPHQVWNRGTRTMKVAWNRTTVETLELAMNEALPKARLVCRDEQYKNKAMVYFALQKYSKLLKAAEKHKQGRSNSKQKDKSDTKVRQLEKDFRRLYSLFSQTLVSESFLPQQQDKCEMVPFEGFITCSYCRCNIFNRFLTCTSCIIRGGDEEDTYDICMDCYAMGRSCACISKLKWVEQFPWPELTQRHEAWRHQILAYEGKVTDKSPMSLKVELQRIGRKRTLAQICQLELKRRPFRDIKKPPPPVEGVEREEQIEIDEEGVIKKKTKIKRSAQFMYEHAMCHIDHYWEPKWKQAQCSSCDKAWCYGTLYRGYDMRPEDILADPDWTCPSCRGMCGCRKCRSQPAYMPYTPSGTRLGHNTKAVADARSVESLVDFSSSNIGWIKKAGDDTVDDTRRLKRRRLEADAAQAKDTDLGEDYVEADADDRDVEGGLLQLAEQEGIPIDPALAAMNGTTHTPASAEDDDALEENPEARHDVDFRNAAMAPQYVIPEGGILRDEDRAYDVIDAITYDYPDPNAMLPAPATIEEDSIAQNGYGPLEPDDDHIEMVTRKRKRNKLDEGDRAFNYNKPLNPPKKKKKRHQSLIVKLPVEKTKLIEINRMAIIAQRALSGVEPAPAAIGSDLQALNSTYPNPEGQPQPKKVRTEQIVVDHDTEYAPSRRRDRRRLGQEGEPSTSREDESTRRQTRKHAVTYEEPSEEDFNDLLVPKTGPSKLSTMEHANDVIDIDDVEPDENSEVRKEKSLPSVREPLDLDISPEPADTTDTPAPPSQTSAVPFRKSTPPVAPRPPTAISHEPTGPAPTSSKLAEAAANRKAKMAVLQGLEDDSDSFDDDSTSEQEDSSPPPRQGERLADIISDTSRSGSERNSPVPAALLSSDVPPVQNPPAAVSKASASVTSSLTLQNVPTSAPPASKAKGTVTAADWDDSDSDNSGIAVKIVPKPGASRAASGWAAINGGAVGMGRGHVARLKPAGAKRGRGRPPLKGHH